MKELIKIAKGFQTSVNIAYDLNNIDKVRGFIPTMSSLDVIEDVLLSTVPTSTQRARILIGAYGRGKSHIVLVLMSMLFRKGKDVDKVMFGALLDKMKSHNPDLYNFAIDYINDDKRKVLPIVVRGSSTRLTQSFLNALQQTLSEEGFSDLMPETHFKAAVTQIENWREKYSDTYKKLNKALSKPVNDFILALNEYDVSAYEEFSTIYPTLTSGSTFNPFLGFDIVELYESIAAKLKDKGFSGVYVIYDEFSKYLESSIAAASNSDIKLLQDFAEKCDRSGNIQMHLMLISHKDIANYIDSNLPKDKVDGWRGVSGRFKHVNLHNNYSQMYEIIAAVIHKSQTQWDIFKRTYENRFSDLKDRFIKFGLLDKNNHDEVDTAIEGCYPLHPISTFILPRLSEKVAQNERTLFTFLSADDRHTLSAFVQMATDDFSLLTPDYIYDYFEPLFRKEPYTSEVHKTYKLTANVLRKVEDKPPLHAKIVKTIALIYLVEQFEKLPPIVDVIVDTFRDSVTSAKEIDLALKELIDNECVVYLKRSNNYLKIKETSGVDIQEEIDRYKAHRLSGKKVSQILNESVFDSFMYPTSYNDNNDIVRYFDFKFLDSKDFWDVTDWSKKISDTKADGVIYSIVPESQEEIEKLCKAILADKKPHKRVVFILPKKWMDISRDALDFAAVAYLKSEAAKSDDEILNDEYTIYEEDLSEVVGSFINCYAHPENGSAYYFHNAEQNIFKRKAQLSGLLSEICEQIFRRTPIINNESINKNELTTNTINSRTKILMGLLANELSPNIGLTGTGQDVSIMRSALLQTSVIEKIETDPKVQLHPADKKMEDMLFEISTFFTEKAARHGGVSFQTLYNTLTLHENGFGLKLGVIPIYVALVLHLYKNNLVINYKGNEVKITPELLNDINVSPKDYLVILEDMNEEKSEYMTRLEEVFAEFVTEREKAYNSFTYLQLAMNRWYLSLPKFAKEMTHKYKATGELKKIDAGMRKFINSLRQLDKLDKGVPDVHARTINHIIKNGRCICGTEVCVGNPAYDGLNRLRDFIPPQSLGNLIEQFRALCGRNVRDTETFFDDFQNKFAEILSFDDDHSENEAEISQVTQKLSDMEDVGKLQAELTKYERQHRSLQSERSDLDRKKGATETSRDRMETERHELTLKDKNNQRIEMYKAYAQYLYGYISAEYTREESRVRQELSKTVDEIFRAIYNGGFSLSLDSKYNVQVIVRDHEGYSEDIETSTAQSISIIFAFIAGVIKMARSSQNPENAMLVSEPYPLVMDAPLSAFDKTRIKTVCTVLPEVAEQVIIFIKDTDGELAETYLDNRIGSRAMFRKENEFETYIDERG